MKRLPSLFISHGAPTFAIEPGLAGPRLTALGRALPRPRAVLVVSPHWMTLSPRVGLVSRPQTIHDFGGFDPGLYEIAYPVDGHPELALRALELLDDAGWAPQPDERRGLDHGAWVPLRHLYPAADVPAFQVSLPARLDGDSAWAFGAALAPLADEGVLIVGSGSLTHNLAEFRSGPGSNEAYAAEFADWVRDVVVRGDSARLRQTLAQAPHARRAHPTTEHFWPLLVAAGAAAAALPATVIEGGITHGVLSMDAFLFGRSGQLATDVA
jgi:4,5-DOPA dioxygenase extradiol